IAAARAAAAAVELARPRAQIRAAARLEVRALELLEHIIAAELEHGFAHDRVGRLVALAHELAERAAAARVDADRANAGKHALERRHHFAEETRAHQAPGAGDDHALGAALVVLDLHDDIADELAGVGRHAVELRAAGGDLGAHVADRV